MLAFVSAYLLINLGEVLSAFFAVEHSEVRLTGALGGVCEVSASVDAKADDLLSFIGGLTYELPLVAFNCSIDVDSFDDLIGILLIED